MKTPIKFLIGSFFVLLLGACQNGPQLRRDSYGSTAQDEKSFLESREAPEEGTAESPSQRIEVIAQPKKRLAVLSFWNDTPVDRENLSLFASEELTRLLAETHKVLLLDDGKMPLKTQDFVQGDRVKVAQLIQEGRRLGVSLLAIGKIAKVVLRQKGDEVGLLRRKYSFAAADVEVKLFDVQGGREIMAATRTGQASESALAAFESKSLDDASYRSELTQEAIRQAFFGLVSDLAKATDKTAWQGRIARVVGPKIYVNAGRASGLITGDILRVIGMGDDIYDPVTGAYLGRSNGLLKGTLEVVDFIGPDAGLAHVHTGANFQEGDLVQLY